MNATLQALKTVPELHIALKKFNGGMKEGDNANNITVSMRDLFNVLNNSTQPVPPFVFLQILRFAFPQFAQKGNHGESMQQDAEECYTQLLIALGQKLPKIEETRKLTDSSTPTSAISQIFSGNLLTR